jgi:HD-GYP domain-containing protein (c-di-GMP phosphodiesterase class II)
MGYPNRIKKDELLIEARILAIADSFDAMTSDRPYRKALPLDIAIIELHENAGSQFDPAIIEVFSQLIEDGSLYHSRFTEALPALLDTVDFA